MFDQKDGFSKNKPNEDLKFLPKHKTLLFLNICSRQFSFQSVFLCVSEELDLHKSGSSLENVDIFGDFLDEFGGQWLLN